MGTAMAVRMSMIVKATINSISVNPFCFPRLIPTSLLHRDGELGCRVRYHRPLGVSHGKVRNRDHAGAAGYGLELQSDQRARPSHAARARRTVELDDGNAVIVQNVLGEERRRAA